MMEVAATDKHDSDDSREREALVLARIYALVIESHASKKAAYGSRPDDERGSMDDLAKHK